MMTADMRQEQTGPLAAGPFTAKPHGRSFTPATGSSKWSRGPVCKQEKGSFHAPSGCDDRCVPLHYRLLCFSVAHEGGPR